MSDKFSDLTHQVLVKAGWNPSRSIDIEYYVRELEKDGYEVFDVVKRFLKKYGGIKTLNLHEEHTPTTCDFHFNPVKVIHSERVEYLYRERINVRLCVIGEACNDHLVLLMTHEGKVYGGYEEYLAFVGDSGESAIEALVHNLDFQEIPPGRDNKVSRDLDL